MQAEQQSEREAIPDCSCGNSYLAIRTDIYKDKREFIYCDCCGAMATRGLWSAALSHPSTPQGWTQIGWTCGDGDCGCIHEAPGADGAYAVPVYVQAPPEQGSKG